MNPRSCLIFRISHLRAVAVCACACFLVAIFAFAQGDLNPPGAPAPTMKALDQLEPRTIVNAANTPGDANNTFIISAPGSYYLTGNITGTEGKHGISIQADDVTLDLSGFALISGGGVSRGVDVPPGQKNFAIRNGTVRDWVDGGVRADLAIGTLVEKLRLSNNTSTGLVMGRGSARDCVAVENDIGFRVLNGGQISDSAANANNIGFSADDRAHISNCISTENSGVGFSGSNFVTLIDCTASRNFGAAGIVVQGSCIVVRCNASRNLPNGSGITAGPDCTIADCVTGNNGMRGISAGAGCTVQNCTATANTQDGIQVGQNCTVTNCTATGNSSAQYAGIYADSGSTVSACTANQNYIGFDVAGSTVTNCTARVNLHHGFIVGGSCNVIGNTALGNNSGFFVFLAGSRIEANNAVGNSDKGFNILSSGTLLVRNSARGNGQNYFLSGAYGRILDMSAGGQITVSEPWVNFSY